MMQPEGTPSEATLTDKRHQELFALDPAVRAPTCHLLISQKPSADGD